MTFLYDTVGLMFRVGSLSSPVLALQHVILPHRPSERGGVLYILIEGATDGSIAFWDLTIEAFSFHATCIST
ncbi:hypothetical protein DVH24_036058 [Malus domestica]|uniref:Uncharacterized protein n=1 Tax=Malus domestica TaxID=3750 RepID=A0A498KT86_MALDO|nr:hypothetical protein DVH24_036058 [Malus domestica]